ncbi:MAG: hypothetical protein Q8Q13_02725 [bacterium]|nr:hypothetical protein [bacterium]
MNILGWILVALGALALGAFMWEKNHAKTLPQAETAEALKSFAQITLPVGAVILAAGAFGYWG